jgi:hypothetical protein
MTQKRKAELQRKLSMAPVAKPPSDLSEKIKADIPLYLDAEQERRRLSSSIGFSLRVAASVILLVTSVFLSIQLLSRDELSEVGVVSSKEAIEPAVVRSPRLGETATAAAPSLESAAVGQKLKDEQVSPPVVAAAKPAPPPARSAFARTNEVAAAAAESDRDLRQVPPAAPALDAASSGVIGGLTSAPAAAPPPPPTVQAHHDAAPQPEAKDDAAARDAAAEKRSEPALVAESEAGLGARRQRADMAKAVTARAETITLTASAPKVEEQSMNVAQNVAPFGISTDPQAFARVKTILESGRKPQSEVVDVAALVNYFAAGPERWPREVQMTVEASRAPLAADGASMIRFTIDSSIAVQVRLTVDINEKAMSSHRFLSGERLAQQIDERMQPRQSVTGLIEIQPLPRLSASYRVATFTLQYLSPEGQPRHLTGTIRVRDLERAWSAASRRHRLATLGALWSESLRASSPSAAIARMASELAGEQPGDTRASDLATAARVVIR